MWNVSENQYLQLPYKHLYRFVGQATPIATLFTEKSLILVPRSQKFPKSDSLYSVDAILKAINPLSKSYLRNHHLILMNLIKTNKNSMNYSPQWDRSYQSDKVGKVVDMRWRTRVPSDDIHRLHHIDSFLLIPKIPNPPVDRRHPYHFHHVS